MPLSHGMLLTLHENELSPLVFTGQRGMQHTTSFTCGSPAGTRGSQGGRLYVAVQGR